MCHPSPQILTLFQILKDISYTLLLARGGGGYLPTLWVWECRPRLQILTLFQTPKDISYTLLLARGGKGGGGLLTYTWVWECRPRLQILTLFQTKLQKSIPYFRPDDIRLSQDQYKHRGRRVFRILLIFCSETAKWRSATVILEQIKKIFKVHKLFEKTVPFSRLLKQIVYTLPHQTGPNTITLKGGTYPYSHVRGILSG